MEGLLSLVWCWSMKYTAKQDCKLTYSVSEATGRIDRALQFRKLWRKRRWSYPRNKNLKRYRQTLTTIGLYQHQRGMVLTAMVLFIDICKRLFWLSRQCSVFTFIQAGLIFLLGSLVRHAPGSSWWTLFFLIFWRVTLISLRTGWDLFLKDLKILFRSSAFRRRIGMVCQHVLLSSSAAFESS